MRFVPRHLPVTHSSVARLAEYIAESKRMLVLTGAGLSTESGLPDYRSEDVGLYARTNRRPINYQTFIRSEEARKRYWARNFIGWPYFSQVQPNAGHFILADWFNKNRLFGIITQNVDRLHQRAGSNDVLELHGTTHIVKCLNCGNLCKRSELQQRFVELNPTLGEYDSPNVETVAPDGDIELPEEIVRQFRNHWSKSVVFNNKPVLT
ncbi:unnamed protein product [Calicophoron daubneyi]|uniref:Deacetylase sirtuin-type domain-containing protein n=1 Tax=Calicophoron daubneyi TaxID=300641 RepID=A0AAV2TQF6_CALDB